jgi:hypothetical protein
VVLRGIRDSRTSGVADLDAGIGQAPDLNCSYEQKDKYRQYKGELYKSLPFVLT